MASGVRCCMSSFLVPSGVPRRTNPIVINSCRWSVTQTLTSHFFKTRFCPSHLSSASAFGCSKKFRVSIRDFGTRHVILAQLEERPLEGFEVTSNPAFVESASFREFESKGYTVEQEEILGGGGGIEGGLGSGGNGDGGKNWNNHGGESEEGKGNEGRKKMLMSQKFTLAYAALIGAGGVAGFIKVGSKKSLAAGGLSALLLFFVYLQLPSSPVFASSVGLGVSAALLTVMGSRFKASGKVFPAGVVSLVSLIMTGGYFHGIMRSMHT